LRNSYADILKVTSADVFQYGSFIVFDSQAQGVVSFFRQHNDQTVAYIGQIGDAPQGFAAQTLDISPIARYAGAHERVRLTNLLSSVSSTIEQAHGAFRVKAEMLGVNADTSFCLIEATASK
jgi:hypothetical protein